MTEPQLRNVRIAGLDRRQNVRRSLGDLGDLVKSISDVGVLTPVTVTPHDSGEGWYLVAGHRRVAAAEAAGMATVPALVHTAGDDGERILATLVENLQRLDLDPVDEAVGYRRLVDSGWSQAEVARRVRRSRGHVSRRLRILVLPDEVQAMVSEGGVTVEHAYTLSRLVDKGVDAEDVISAATDPEGANTRLRGIETDEQREHRRRKLERGGVEVILVDRLWHADHHEVSYLGLDGDHSTEPCHAVVLHFNTYGTTTLGEDAVCTEYDRHQADGASALKVHSARREDAAKRREREQREADHAAEQAEREAEHASRLLSLTARLQALPDEVVTAAMLRLAARQVLKLPRFDDPLLPVPEGCVDPDMGWMLPAQVIDSAPVGDVARAVARFWLGQSEGRWFHRPRLNKVLTALRDRLPEAPDEPHLEAEVA